MGRATRLSSRGVRFIARFEGGQSPDGLFRAYWDPYGQVWTQGYGHTGSHITRDKPWSRAKALRILREDAEWATAAVLEAWGGKRLLRQYELDALTAAVFNLGAGVLDPGRSLGNAVRAGKRRATAQALLLYVYAGGQKLAGLVRRRRAERKRFLHKYRKPKRG